jgi:hypothetical protein
MTTSQRLPAPADLWDRLVRHYEARQKVVTNWPELSDYICLLRQIAESLLADRVRPWQFLDLLVIGRADEGAPRGTSATVQIAPGRSVQIARMKGGATKQVTVEQVTCSYADAWPRIEEQLLKLLDPT